MATDPTTTISWDYLVELSDDGNQPDQPEMEVIVMPPVPPAADGLPVQRQEPQP